MTDFGASGRTDTYWCDLVDPFSLRKVGTVRMDPEKTDITWGWGTDNCVQAKVSLLQDFAVMEGATTADSTDYADRDKMLRIWQKVSIPSQGYQEERTLCTLFIEDVSRTNLNALARRDYSCYGAMYRFTQDSIINDLSKRKGANVVQAIRELVTWSGGQLAVNPDVDQKKAFGRDIWFQIGKNRAEVIRTIAGWLNCRVDVNPWGQIVLERYVAPSKRHVSYQFVDGTDCTYVPGYDMDTNRAEPVNRVVAYFSRESKSKGDKFPLSDRAVVESPDGHPFSYKRCGRHRTHVMQVSEPCSHSDLVAKAKKYLADNDQAALDIQIEHVQIPGLMPGQVVRFRDSREGGIDWRAQVMEIATTKLVPAMMCKTKLRLVGGWR